MVDLDEMEVVNYVLDNDGGLHVSGHQRMVNVQM